MGDTPYNFILRYGLERASIAVTRRGENFDVRTKQPADCARVRTESLVE
jgi:hypothetical protein